MADILDPRVASNISQHLTDIATKLEGIRAFKNISVDLELPDIDNFNAQLREEYRALQNVRRVWRDVGADLYQVKRRKLELFRAEKQLREESDRVYKLQQKARAAATRDPVREQELQDHYDEIVDKLKHVNAGLKELAGSQKEQEVVTNHTKRALFDFGHRVLGKVVVGALQLTTGAIGVLETAVLKSYDINNRFRASFAGIAASIGSATPELGQFQAAAQSMYFERGGLGDLGMDLGAVSAEVGAFGAALGVMDRSFVGNTSTLLTHSRALGLSGAEAGDAARSFMLMGQSADDLDGVMGRVIKTSKALGVSTTLLAKNVLSAGKGLLSLAGPKWQDQMVGAIARITKMGLSVQALERVTDLTDTFDKNAEAMAKLNTAFGTHINALALFAEQDPGKRFEMITEQLNQQGKTVASLGRQEKRFLAETLGVTIDEVNAMAKWGEAHEDVSAKLKEAQAASADWASALSQLRTTLVNWGRIFDKVLLSVMRAINPVLKVFGLSGPDSLGSGIQGITGLAERMGDRVVKVFDRLAGSTKFQEGMTRIGQIIQNMGAALVDFVEGPGFPKLVDTVSRLFTFLIEHSKELFALWVGFKLGSIAYSMVLAIGSISTAVGGLSAVFGVLGVSIWAALAPLLPLLALAGLAGFLAFTSPGAKAEQEKAQRAGVFSGATAPTGFSGASLVPQAAAVSSAGAGPTAAQPPSVPAPALGSFGAAGAGRGSGGLAGGSAPAPDIRLNQPIQVYVDGNLASEQQVVSHLRSVQ